MNNKYFQIELDKQNEKVEIHLNQEGLEYLINILNTLSQKKDCDHIHLMTSSWGGEELTEYKIQEGNILINHLKIYKWMNNQNP